MDTSIPKTAHEIKVLLSGIIDCITYNQRIDYRDIIGLKSYNDDPACTGKSISVFLQIVTATRKSSEKNEFVLLRDYYHVVGVLSKQNYLLSY